MIDIDTIPDSRITPGHHIEFNYLAGKTGLPATDYKILLVGSKIAAGSQAVDTPVEITGEDQGVELFGEGSILDCMIRAAFKANHNIECWAVAMTEATGVQATEDIVFAGTATADGFVELYLAGRRINVAVTSGEAHTTVSANVEAAINEVPSLPCTASDAAGTVTITAVQKGVLGNEITIRDESDAPGITVTPGAAVLSAGTGDYDPTSTLVACAATRYALIVCAANDAAALGVVETHLDTYGGALEQKGQVAMFGFNGSLANAKTLADTLKNCERGQVLWALGTDSLSYEFAAIKAARRAQYSAPNANLDNEEMVGMYVPNAKADWPTAAEIESALGDGVCVIKCDGTKMRIARNISTYTETDGGIPDTTMLDLDTVEVLDYFRDALISAWGALFTGPSAVADADKPAAVRDETLRVARVLETMKVLKDIETYKANFQAEWDTNVPTRIRVAIPAPVVPGLHQLFGKMVLYF